MEIQHREGPQSGKFFIEKDGKNIAALVYFKDDKCIAIEHTEVDRSLRGQNIGYELVRSAVAFARSRRFSVSPVCPFAKALFKRNPEWQDLTG